MPRLVLSLGLGALLGAAPAALAQPDPGAAPGHGTVALEEGFMPDPHAVDVTAGGTEEASAADAACNGYVAAAPSVVLDYGAADGTPLHVFVRSSSDTVLLVRTPDGAWLCNDDEDGVNAGLYFDEPARGRYAVWVGTYSGGAEETPATLYFSEVDEAAVELDPAGAPSSGTVALVSGFSPDPHEVAVTAGGPISMTAYEGCAGYVDPGAPTAVLDLDTDGGLPLYVYARPEGDDDLTLIVSGPDGTIYCNDDAEDLNPGLVIEAPTSGRYAVWVGTFSSRARTEEPARATLSVSEVEGPTADFDDFGDDYFGDDDFGDGTYEGGEGISLFAEPAHGALTLEPGFGAEEVTVTAGGGDEMSVSGSGCAGYISNGEPDVNVLFGGGGEAGVLAFSVEADDDTTLLVNLPDGSWRCSDDEIGRNPAVVVEGPSGGLYNVWVGTFSQDAAGAPATLRITESDPR